MSLTVEEIKELMREMAENGLTDFELQSGTDHLSMHIEPTNKLAAPVQEHRDPPAITGADVAQPQAEEAAVSAEDEQPRTYAGTVISSPVVGIFFAAPAPDAKPFVEVGQRVDAGDVLCIVEAMKLLNEVNSTTSGVVSEILVSNGDRVEYGQPLMVIG